MRPYTDCNTEKRGHTSFRLSGFEAMIPCYSSQGHSHIN